MNDVITLCAAYLLCETLQYVALNGSEVGMHVAFLVDSHAFHQHNHELMYERPSQGPSTPRDRYSHPTHQQSTMTNGSLSLAYMTESPFHLSCVLAWPRL